MIAKYYNSDKFKTTIKVFRDETMVVARAIPWKPEILSIVNAESSEYETWQSMIDGNHPLTEPLDECEENVFSMRLGEVLMLCRNFPNNK